jgi:hypothetical protein
MMMMSDEPDPDVTDRDRGMDLAVDRLLADSEGVRVAVASLEAAGDEATEVYVAEVEDALASMELDLQIARAALAVRVADDAASIERPVDEIAEVLRGWFEEMTVRSRLAGMEATDRIQQLTSRLERATSVSRSSVERLGDDLGDDLEELRAAALATLHDTRVALGNAAAAIRRSG